MSAASTATLSLPVPLTSAVAVRVPVLTFTGLAAIAKSIVTTLPL